MSPDGMSVSILHLLHLLQLQIEEQVQQRASTFTPSQPQLKYIFTQQFDCDY